MSSFGSMQLGTQQSLETFFGDSEGLSKALASRAVLSLPAEGSALPNASRALRHESALGHATGSALYVHDQATRRSMLSRSSVTV